jgi:hypothetical protein
MLILPADMKKTAHACFITGGGMLLESHAMKGEFS